MNNKNKKNELQSSLDPTHHQPTINMPDDTKKPAASDLSAAPCSQLREWCVNSILSPSKHGGTQITRVYDMAYNDAITAMLEEINKIEAENEKIYHRLALSITFKVVTMKIEKKETFIVDGHVFTTKEAAEERVEVLRIAGEVFNYNGWALDSSDLKYVPVEVDGETDIFYQEKEHNWVVWKSIIKDQQLRYYSNETDKIKLLTPQEYLDRLGKVYIDSNEWGHFIHALILFGDNSTIDYKQILNKLGKIEITPQYIYD